MAYPINGCKLTEETIKNAVFLLPRPWWKQVVWMWNEYIPGDMELTDEEKLSWIFASLPGAETCLASYIADFVKTGPSDMRKPNELFRKPNVIRNFVKKYPDFAREVASVCGQGKPIPDKYKTNDNWLCVLALSYAIDWAGYDMEWLDLHGGNADSIYILFSSWLVPAREELRKRG